MTVQIEICKEEDIMRNISIVLVLILTLSFREHLAAVCKFTNAVCESFNQSWVTFEQCRLRAISRHKTVLNINATFHYPAARIVIKYKVLKKANGYKPFLIDSTVDACAFMRKPNHPFVKMIFDFVKNYSSITHTCPYVGPQWVKDFYVDGETVRLPVPTGDYAIFLSWGFFGRPQFITNVYFTFEEDLLKQ